VGRIKIARVGDGPLWAIGSTYFSPALVEHAKAVPGMTFDNPTRTWHGYPDAVTATVARLATKGIHCDGDEDLPDAESWRTARSPFLFATSGAVGQTLRDYQVEGVRFLVARAREGALLADGMRLGKSAQSTVAARVFKGRTLIICPSHVVGVWGRPKTAPEGPGEIAKWWPDAWKPLPPPGSEDAGPPSAGESPGVICLESIKPAKAQALARALAGKSKLTADEQAKLTAAQAELESRAKALEHVQVIVCHYDIIYAWVDVLKMWGVGTLILDEIHICAGWQSRRSDALKELSEAAKRRIGLTGTPVTNLPKNLHNVLEILAPNRFGYFFTGARPGCYSKVFCGSFQKTVGSGPEQKVVWDHSGRSNLDEPDGKTALTQEETLSARLKFLMLRRLKKDVDPQLPTKTRQIVDVSIPARHVINVSQSMLGPGGGELRRCLDLAADGKLKSVVALVESHVAEEEKVLCFCYRRLFAERVAGDLNVRDGTMVTFVHGGLTQKERDRRIHKLREHDGPGVLACTIDTTSTGIDLSFANVAVVGELSWEPHELVQLEERLYKFGKNAKALIQYVIARGTGDELILRGVINKLNTFERVIGETGDKMKEELSKKKEGGMQRLFAALAEMQKAGTVAATKPKRGRAS
jgi:SNF2 family DNA or RNA helicase